MTEFLLNEEQQKAVQDTEGAILVIAGAGSGKTRVLTARICHLIDIGVDPYNILAITFTNKAANEMKNRISSANCAGASVWTSTFHSMCAKILRIDCDKLNYDSNFTIYTDIESERVVKRICGDYLASDVKKKAIYLWHISRAKTYGLSPAEYYEKIRETDEDADIILNIYRMYEDELKKSNAMDFDDLLLKTVELFENNLDVLKKYQHRFKYIHVDEFQDTNTLQYKLVKLLCGEYGNIFVVGDEDQSIYSWRGAEIRNILDFHKDFANSKTYKLEQNYRSTTSILNCANNVIRHNCERNEKMLWSDIKEDNSVEYYEAATDRDEAAYVTRQIAYLASMGGSYKDSAVLVRANALTRLFEEDFNLHGIPYKVFGGFRFFERKEIKDALAYVRLAINPSDNDSIMRIINYPKRGIGNTAVEALANIATEQNTTLFSVLINPSVFTASVSKKLAQFTEIAMDLIENSKKMQAVEFMQYVLIRSGLESSLQNSTDVDDANRLENIEELVSAVQQFQNDNPTLGISDFMQSVALVSDTDNMDEDNYVTIATIHAVKGLEFKNVFVVGLEEGIFPTNRALASGDIEEERRLMYVAITRAKSQFYAINARSRFRFGETLYSPKSRFVTEMRGSVEAIRAANTVERYGLGQQTKFGFKQTTLTQSVSFGINAAEKRKTKTFDFSDYKNGTVVEHAKFGRGKIIALEGLGDNVTASIDFQGLGVKRFSLAIAVNMLKIVEE
ncbi:MAG: UvrD-helicase domain-containing protein [Clostridia bacterium]